MRGVLGAGASLGRGLRGRGQGGLLRALWALGTLSILKKLRLQEAGERPRERAFECFLGEGALRKI